MGLTLSLPNGSDNPLIKSLLAHWQSFCSAVLPNPSWIYTLAVRILSYLKSAPMCERFPHFKTNLTFCHSERSEESLRPFAVLRVTFCFSVCLSVRFNSIVSGFPTLIEVRRSRKRHCLSAENSMAFAAYKIHYILWNLFQFLNHDFCALVNVATAEGDYHVTLFCVCEHIVRNFLKAVEPHTSGDFFCEVLCVNAVGVNLT